MTYLLAVDPGMMTGWAALIDGEFTSGEMSMDDFLDWGRHDFALENPNGSGEETPSEIVSESYIITQSTLRKSRGENWSLEQIGVLRFLAGSWRIPFSTQSPSDAKSFSGDDKLKKLEWYARGKGHANDAARHLLLYCIKHKLIDPRLLVA